MKRTLLKASVLGMMLAGVLGWDQAYGQSDPTGKKQVTSTYAITNATVFANASSSGSKATVLIKDGVIKAIGSNISLPAEAQEIKGDSLFIYPGFIDGASRAGITRPEDPKRPDNFVSSNPPDEIAGITPWRNALDQFSIKSSQVDDLRKAGFTLAQILPDGGMIAGKSAIVVLGDESSTNLVKENSGLAASLQGSRGMYPGTAVGVMAKFRDVYKNTELTQERIAKFTSSTGISRPEMTPTYMGMSDVVDGQVPVVFTVGNDLEVRRAISLQEELGFNLVLTGLEEYDAVIDLIKSSGTKVLIKLEIPDDKAIKAQKEDVNEDVKAQYEKVKEAYDLAISQAGKLEKAGVPFAFTTVGAQASDISKAITKMMEAGLSKEGAIAALTSNAASILGIERIAGTLDNGKMANMVITTGPIFEEDSQIKHVVVDGKIFDYEISKKKNGKDDGKAVDPSGNWTYTSETPAGSSGGNFTIEKSDSDLSGEITYDDPQGGGETSSPLKEIEVSGSNLSFSFGVNAGGMSLDVKVSGEINGDTMSGNMTITDFGSYSITANRTPSLIAKK
ncbi:amidohydrolase family protein [Algoriphagus hitonicola]|uniref:Imidazolonepropionase n=1 Tax=Algoriphagus hitonicola TaxID=435880 RepID=A0A1I2R6S3_9BACT|nr:amidohydrolase family protein [Algoriphagus hitonicola]SFG36424.1 Imidazolonepropionase [Algoriphagus hitonicola]